MGFISAFKRLSPSFTSNYWTVSCANMKLNNIFQNSVQNINLPMSGKIYPRKPVDPMYSPLVILTEFLIDTVILIPRNNIFVHEGAISVRNISSK
jgi:hypothetical protein